MGYKYKNDRRKKNRSIVEVSKAINKKGKIKGKNKKETRALKGMCVHHKINKHGNIKPTLRPIGKKHLQCTMCKARVLSASFYDDDSVYAAVEALQEINQQAKFIAAGTNSGNRSIDYFASMGLGLNNYAKTYKKIRALADKQSKMKKKKRKNDYQTGSNKFGKWSKVKR